MSKPFKKLQPEIRKLDNKNETHWQILSEKYAAALGVTYDAASRLNKNGGNVAYCHVTLNPFIIKEEKFHDQSCELVGEKLLPKVLGDMKSDICLYSPTGADAHIDWIAQMASEKGIALERVPVQIADKKFVSGLIARCNPV
jgi:hypothetical protein